MSAPLRGVSRALQLVHKTVAHQRATVISGPPKNQVSMAEKTALGLVMVIAVCAPSAYILANLNNYRGGEVDQ